MAPQQRWIWLLYFTFLWIVQIASKELRVVCYYTNWSVYRPGSAKFSPQNINPYLCTHLVYAFGGFTKENTLKPFDKYQDIEKGGYAKFTGLKTYNKNLKTMLAIGGWNEGSSRFSPMVANAERRKELVKNVVKFLRQNHFDGLDLDWEYPSFRDGGKSRDRENYAQLVQELREEFERESGKTGRTRLLLTMAVPAGIEYINKGYDVPKLMKYLDWMNILSYDYHSAFEPSVNHHAPLYPLEEDNEYNYDTDLNIDHTIKHYLKAGANSEKLVLGIPTYGRSYTLFNPDANEIGAPADGPGEMGDATRENGYLAYYEICESVNNGEWTVVQPNEDAMGPYAYKDNQWVGYDDENIARKKSQYVAENNLGGIMFWAIDNDDFRGTCHNKSYPIIEAAKEALVEALGLSEENVISKPVKTTKTRGRPTRPTKTTEAPAVKQRTQNSGGRQSSSQSSDKPGSRRRIVNRVRGNNKNAVDQSNSNKVQKGKRRRRPTTKSTPIRDEPITRETGSSLVVTTPSYKTPEPPTTPDPGGDFKCEDEGFFPHPRDCKKYFWCLSGPSELGIIAHQFTCPAGLYFNKAAASCDYTQNVLCNKKRNTTPKPTTTASTTEAPKPETTKKAEIFNFSTKRPAAKITAATSRTTFYSTTTTEAPEYYDEYEYEDDVDDEEEEDSADGNDSEDPLVIKELLELIKKAGGIEELEKQLNIKSSDAPQSEGSTTQSTITKKLYERVLAKTKLGDSLNTRKNSVNTRYNTINRNSRGPQNEGIIEGGEKKSEKTRSRESRPQYSTISRQRASKVTEDDEETEDAEEDEAEDASPRGQGQKEASQGPKYVTLRRNRPSTSTVEPDVEESLTKLGESRGTTSTSRSPYVTLRRSRPTTVSTTEESAVTEGKSIRRRPTITRNGEKDNIGEEEEEEDEEEEAKDGVDSSSPNYVVIQRNRPSTTEGSVSKYKEIVRGTTTTVSGITSEDAETTEPLAETTATKSPSSHRSSTQPDTNSITNASDDLTNPIKTNLNEDAEKEKVSENDKQSGTQKFEIKPPKLFEPRPFSISNNTKTTTSTTTTTTTTEKPTTTIKVSQKPLRSRPVVTEAQDSNNVNNNNNNNKVEGGYNRGRNRGSSRFRVPEITTQKISSYNGGGGSYEEYERHYRPDLSADISDLSSLTAVDFSLKGFTGSSPRRSRPRITTIAPETTATEKAEESLKTGPRTLPLARKALSEGGGFGGRRRTTVSTTISTTTEAATQITRKSFKRPLTTLKDAGEGSTTDSALKFKRPITTKSSLESEDRNSTVNKFKRPSFKKDENDETVNKFKRPVFPKPNSGDEETDSTPKFKRPGLPAKTTEVGNGVVKIKRPIFRPKPKVENDEKESSTNSDATAESTTKINEERRRIRPLTSTTDLNESEESAKKKLPLSSSAYQESDTLRRRIRPLSSSGLSESEQATEAVDEKTGRPTLDADEEGSTEKISKRPISSENDVSKIKNTHDEENQIKPTDLPVEGSKLESVDNSKLENKEIIDSKSESSVETKPTSTESVETENTGSTEKKSVEEMFNSEEGESKSQNSGIENLETSPSSNARMSENGFSSGSKVLDEEQSERPSTEKDGASTEKLDNSEEISEDSNETDDSKTKSAIKIKRPTTTTEPPAVTKLNRKVIRRFRVTTPSTTTILDEQSAISSPKTNEEIKISKANPELNNIRQVPIPYARKVRPITETPEAENVVNSTEDEADDDELDEEENIKLSESNILENSDLNRVNNNAINDQGKKGHRKVIKRIKFTTQPTEASTTGFSSTTESVGSLRTRKIIRKLPTTTEAGDDEPKVVIRKFRPKSSSTLYADEATTTESLKNRIKFGLNKKIPVGDKALSKQLPGRLKLFTRRPPSVTTTLDPLSIADIIKFNTSNESTSLLDQDENKKGFYSEEEKLKRLEVYTRTSTTESNEEDVSAKSEESTFSNVTDEYEVKENTTLINQEKDSKKDEGDSKSEEVDDSEKTVKSKKTDGSDSVEDSLKKSNVDLDLSSEAKSTDSEITEETSEENVSEKTVDSNSGLKSGGRLSVLYKGRESATEEDEGKPVLSAKRLKIYSRPSSNGFKPTEAEGSVENAKSEEESVKDDEALLAKRLKLYVRTTTPKPSTTEAIKVEVDEEEEDVTSSSMNDEEKSVDENKEKEIPEEESTETFETSTVFDTIETESTTSNESLQTTESTTPVDSTTDESDITTIDYDVETTTDYETTTEPKPSTPVYVNKIYKSAAIRPKLDLKSRLGLKYTTEASVRSTTRSGKFEARSRRPNRFRTSSSTEANRIEIADNDDVGYGTVKPFKKLFVSTDRPRYRVKNIKLNNNEDDSYEEYDYDDDEEEEDEEIPAEEEKVLSSTTGKYYVNTNSFNRAQYVKPTTESLEVIDDEEEEAEDDEDFPDEEIEEEEGEAISKRPLVVTSRKPVSFISTSVSPNAKTRKANNPYDATTKRVKTSTRAYRRFTSTTPQTTTQNLTDINIEALNQRNKQLFNKTRKMNTPHPGPVTIDPTNEAGVAEDGTESGLIGNEATNSTEFANYNSTEFSIYNSTESVLNLFNGTSEEGNSASSVNTDTNSATVLNEATKQADFASINEFGNGATKQVDSSSISESGSEEANQADFATINQSGNETTKQSDSASVIESGNEAVTNSESNKTQAAGNKFIFGSTYSKSIKSGTVVGTTNFGSTIEVSNSNAGEDIVEASVKSPETTTEVLMYSTNPSEISSDDYEATTFEPALIHSTTTEKFTTFHHIFAETEGTTTSTLNPEEVTPEVRNDQNKVERLIEVNRIVHINGENDTREMHRIVDHVGVVNRVTVIKVVDGNNSTDGSEDKKLAFSFSGPNILTELIGSGLGDKTGNREDRKFEIYGDSKVSNSLNNQYSDVINAKIGESAPNHITIESKSSVKTITPKPLFSNEVSTIALEGLFMTHKPETKTPNEHNPGDIVLTKSFETQNLATETVNIGNNIYNTQTAGSKTIQGQIQEAESSNAKIPATTEYEELLETENSHYVNVKVQNPNNIYIVRPDEEVTMKADVVEISRPITAGLIKIAPISVSFQKRIPNIK